MVHEMFDGLLYHLTYGHTGLAKALHVVWQSLAAHEGCVVELVRVMMTITRQLVPMRTEDAGKR